MFETVSDRREVRSTFFYYAFQSSVGQLTIITSGVIAKAARLEGENVTSVETGPGRLAAGSDGSGGREKDEGRKRR